MFQLDLISNTISGLPGSAKSEAYQMGIDRLDELDKLISERSNTQDFWKKITGNSDFVFDIFAWPDNVQVLSMIGPDLDAAFSVLPDAQRPAMQTAILEMDSDLGRPELDHCSELNFSAYQTALCRTIELFL